MDIGDIIQATQASRVNIIQHTRVEARDDNLLLDDIFSSTRHGEIVENYPSDKPYPSCLIFGKAEPGHPVPSVWAYGADNKIAVLITVYRPDRNQWVDWKIRK
jgi:hypothetical protein